MRKLSCSPTNQEQHGCRSWATYFFKGNSPEPVTSGQRWTGWSCLSPPSHTIHAQKNEETKKNSTTKISQSLSPCRRAHSSSQLSTSRRSSHMRTDSSILFLWLKFSMWNFYKHKRGLTKIKLFSYD